MFEPILMRHAALILICIIGVSGCQSIPDHLTGNVNDIRPAAIIQHPGVVAVDALVRRELLENEGILELMCRGSGSAPTYVFHTVESPSGYGLDDRYYPIATAFRDLGKSCLGGNVKSCKSIQAYSLKWATLSKLDGYSDIWADTLSVNMRLLVPMIAALGVAEQTTPLNDADRRVLTNWLKNKVDRFKHGMRTEGNYSGNTGITSRKAAGNHAIQSSLAAMSFGSWAGTNSYFQTGIEQWFITLSSMRADGSLPIETRRGARALFYHGRTISALVQLAERARVQNIDLYGSAPNLNKTLHHAVAFFIDAVENPEVVLRYAKRNKSPGPSKNYRKQHLGYNGSTMGWIAPYMARFPVHPNTIRLKSLQDLDFNDQNDLVKSLISAVDAGGYSSEWIGVNAKCFYATYDK